MATPRALVALAQNGANQDEYVKRHQRGDWGDVDPGDAEANAIALAESLPITSAYTLGDGTRLWLITEGDRSATTILLADEY